MSSSSATIEEGSGSGLVRLGASHVADPAISSLRDIEIFVGRMVANAQQDADELRAQARQDAAAILDDARREAGRILDDARSHASQASLSQHASVKAVTATSPTTIDRETISALVAYLDDAGAIQRRITSTVRAAIEAALAATEP
jgi:cell division septum initiation protein DivIVA